MLVIKRFTSPMFVAQITHIFHLCWFFSTWLNLPSIFRMPLWKKNHGQNHQTDLPVCFETLKSPTKQISCDRNAVRSGEAHWPSLVVLGLRSRPGMLGNGHGIRPVTSLVTVCWLGRYDVQHRETMGKLYFNYISWKIYQATICLWVVNWM